MLDDRTVALVVEKLGGLPVDPEIFKKFALILESVSSGLSVSKIEIPIDIEPCFMRAIWS